MRAFLELSFGNARAFAYGAADSNAPMTRPLHSRFRRPAAILALLFGALGGWICPPHATNAAELSSAPPQSATAATGTNRVPFQRLDDGCIQIGKVRLDARQRTVSFPALVNMNDGIIEYLLVTTTGKTHESLLRTEAEPFHIQTAMLLLGLKGATRETLTNAPAGGQISAEALRLASAAPLVGERVEIAVEWITAGKTNRCALEDFVLEVKAAAPMKRGPFVFTGSRVFEGIFLAQQEGSLISVITDLTAVFNNPRPRRDDEDNWKIAGAALPPLDSSVRVTISVPPVTANDK